MQSDSSNEYSISLSFWLEEQSLPSPDDPPMRLSPMLAQEVGFRALNTPSEFWCVRQRGGLHSQQLAMHRSSTL